MVFQQKILKLFKNDISLQLTNVVNLSFSTGVFLSGLKIAKVIPIHKKESKPKCSNYPANIRLDEDVLKTS